MHILILGEYSLGSNLSRDAYKLTIPALLKDVIPHTYDFRSFHDVFGGKDKYDAILVGGGDLFILPVITKLIELKKENIPIIGLAIGVPYESMITYEHLEIFDYFFTRNRSDLSILRMRSHSLKINYLPDPFALIRHTGKGRNMRLIGFILQDLSEETHLIRKLDRLFTRLGSRNYTIRLFVFDAPLLFSPEDDGGDDRKGDMKLYEKFTPKSFIQIIPYKSLNETLDSISECATLLTERYHGMWAGMVCGIPIIPLILTRRTELLNEYIDSPHFIFLKEEEEDEINLSVKETVRLIEESIDSDTQLQDRYVNKCRKYLSGIFSSDKGNKIIRLIESLKGISFLNENIKAQSLSDRLFHIPDSSYLDEIKTKLEQNETIDENEIIERHRKDAPSIPNVSLRVNPSQISYYLPIEEYEFHHQSSGWRDVFAYFSIYSKQYGIYLDSFIERTFIYNREYNLSIGKIPYMMEWIGFIHSSYDKIELMLKDKTFLDSLNMCKCLYVMSQELKMKIIDNLGERKIRIPVYFLEYPVDINVKTFNMDIWKKERIVLTDDMNLKYPLKEIINTNISFENRIILLSSYTHENIDILIKCIVHRTPVIINRSSETIRLLGKEYPLFHDKSDDTTSLIRDDIIGKGIKHLEGINKKHFRFETFFYNLHMSGALIR